MIVSRADVVGRNWWLCQDHCSTDKRFQVDWYLIACFTRSLVRSTPSESVAHQASQDAIPHHGGHRPRRNHRNPDIASIEFLRAYARVRAGEVRATYPSYWSAGPPAGSRVSCS